MTLVKEYLLATVTYIGPISRLSIQNYKLMPDIQYLNIIFPHLEVWSS